MDKDIKIGSTFDIKEREQQTELWYNIVEFCNKNNAYVEIADDKKTFKILEYIVSSEQKKNIENAKLQSWLKETDNYALRLATGEAKEDDWSDTYSCTFKEIMSQRDKIRKELKEKT